ncbi:MAG TPA: tetratricopeptide repeat protein, partial [Pseudonocardiaceae bacterium]|nr:tetratricopeptide repeat protein [Pseudonocardiaceae bacterium]
HHPFTLNCRHGLAVRLREERRWDDAEREFRAVYEISRQLPERGPNHPATLTVRAWLASLLRERGELAEAEAEYRILVAADTRVYGADDKVTLGARSALALVLRQSGQFAKAEREYRVLMKKFTHVYGVEDKVTLGARAGLAVVLRAEGKLAEAESEYRLVADADTRVYGPDHQVTVHARAGLSSLLRERGELVEAEQEYRAILEVLGRMSDPGDNVIVVQRSLAVVLIEKGRQIVQSAKADGRKGDGIVSDDDLVDGPQWFHSAMAAFTDAISLIDADKSPGLYGVVLHDMAAAHAAAGNLQEAAAGYGESAQYKRRAGNKGDLLLTLQAMADCLIKARELAAVWTVLDEAKEILADSELNRRSIRLYHLGRSYEMLGVLGQDGAYDQALATYQETLELLDVETDLGSYATVWHDIGDVYIARGRVKDAIAAYQQAVDHMRRYSHDDDSLRSFLIDLGRALVQLGESEDGVSYDGDRKTVDDRD